MRAHRVAVGVAAITAMAKARALLHVWQEPLRTCHTVSPMMVSRNCCGALTGCERGKNVGDRGGTSGECGDCGARAHARQPRSPSRL